MATEKKIVVITGASGALGSALVERFHDSGLLVVGWDVRAKGSGELTGDEKREGVQWMRVDLSDGAAIEKATETVEREVGPVYGVVHCAGGFRWSLIDQIGTEDIDFLVDVNLRSSLYLASAVMKRFKDRKRGRLVFVSSRSTISPGTGEGAYAATKAGLNALTRSLAVEVKDLQITVNALQPSIINTPDNRQAMPDADHASWVTTKDLADLVEYLLDEKGQAISGSLITVSGRT